MAVFRRRNVSSHQTSKSEGLYFSRGWIDGVFLNSQEGVFDAYRGSSLPFFTFRETYVREADESLQAERDQRDATRGSRPKYQISWAQIEWVRLDNRESVPEGIADFHDEILKSSTDPHVVSGHLKRPLDTGGEFFSVIGDLDRSSREWLDLFSRMGAKVLDPE